jgi:M6 family metalloprotease-like protein
MSVEDSVGKSGPQFGFKAMRKGTPAEPAGRPVPGGTEGGPGETQKARERGGEVLAIFGSDDQYVATFQAESLRVDSFETVGEPSKPLLYANIGVVFVRIRAAGRALSLVLYGIDREGAAWSIDLRPRGGRGDGPDLARQPRLRRVAETIDARLDDLVVLRRAIVLQELVPAGGVRLWRMDRRSGAIAEIGTLDLDPGLSALDAARHDILLGHHKGEMRLVLFGQDTADGGFEIHELDVDRATAAVVVGGTHLVLARKGGLVQKADLRVALPEKAQHPADPLARACHLLRQLLERCGCECKGGHPGDGGDPDRPDGGPDGGPSDRPCDDRHSARLGFTAHRLYRVNRYLVATDRGATRMAILDDRLNVQVERKLDRVGAHILAGQPHSQNMLIHQARLAEIEAWRVADYVRELAPRLPEGFRERPVARPVPSVTYWGQRYPRAELNPTVRVCIFPVVDAGQTYGDPNMSKLIDQVSAKIFSVVDDYYDECSFGECGIDFTVFGYDLGGPRKPLVLPRAQASYWYDSFRPGGLQAVMPADWSNPVRFDGNEALEFRANPRAGAVRTYDLPFAAMWSSGNLGNFPVTLTFNGSETLELEVRTQGGTTHTLNLAFPATSLTVDQGGDIEGFLSDLGDLVTAAIRTAEAALPGNPTLIQDVEFRRVRTSSNASAFGLVQGRFRIAPSGGATQKGRISVAAPAPGAPLSTLGLTPTGAIRGAMDSQSAVTNYVRECLRAAQVDAGEGIGGGSTTYFQTSPSANVDAMAQEITVLINLTNDTGGQLASMELVSSSGLSGTGLDTAVPNPGSESGPNNTNTLRDSIDLANDTFTAALDHIRATSAWNRAAVEAMFSNFDVMMIAHVGAPHAAIPAADQWACDDPAGFTGKRMYKRTHFATDLNPPGGETPVQMGTSAVTGQRFNAFDSPQLTNQAGVMAHELGHALGLPDLYAANGYRDDVAYVDPWAMMAGGNANFHHFIGWSKWKLGWIADEPDPNLNRTIFVDLPAPVGTTVTEAWLVPIEYWDAAMRNDVRNEVGGSIEIGHLMKLNLGSDGGVTAFLELRASGASFSLSLNPQPTVIATNGLDPDSDIHWAVNGLYRRACHLLNNGTELRNVGDRWDFAAAPEFPVKGCVAEVVEIRTVRGSIPVFLVRIEREQAEFIDLYFQDHVPSYKSPDIWVDWRGDNPDPDVPRVYPVGTPTDQGETVRYPGSGVEPHFVVARVHNAGNVRAEDVKVRWFICDPPGVGDSGRWVNVGTRTIPEVGPGANEITAFDWNVDSSTNVHQCMRMEIIDWTIPSEVDPATGDTVALASDDVKLQNNNAQQNVFDFEALAGSPYDPISFPMQVHNDRLMIEVAALVPNGLPYGAELTISPREHTIPSGEARIFHCTLQLDDAVIRPGCDNDSGFLLSAWRRGGEADEIWGSCFYHIRPRWRTEIEIVRGHWFHGQVRVYGVFRTVTDTPIDIGEDMPLHARVRLLGDAPGSLPVWHVVAIQPDGTFVLETQHEESKAMTVQAWFDRTDRLGSSVSNVWGMNQEFLG